MPVLTSGSDIKHLAGGSGLKAGDTVRTIVRYRSPCTMHGIACNLLRRRVRLLRHGHKLL
jgi:hypothetical protein